jgi:putative tricarboxylic transport membrane protein
MTPEAHEGGARRQGRIMSPHDVAGGLFLLALAGIGFFGAFNLPFGQLSGIGSGLMPKTVAVLVGAFGVLLLLRGLLLPGAQLGHWSLRGPIFVVGSVIVFAMTIRPWGLVVAGPLAVIISSLADRDTKAAELAVLAVALTLGCGLLFKELLGLPIPFDPAGLIPEPLPHAYAAVKAGIVQLLAAVKAMIGG